MFSKVSPLFMIGKFPVTVTGLIILVQLVGMVVWAVSGGSVTQFTRFTPEAVLEGELWRMVTYPLCAPIGAMALLGLFFFYQFGTEVEKVMPRKTFVRMVVLTLITGPLVLLLFSLMLDGEAKSVLVGADFLHLAVFCGFCVMFPNMPTLFLRVPIKWLGLAFFILALLSALAMRQWGTLVAITLSVGLTLAIIQSSGYAILRLIPDALIPGGRQKKGKPGKKVRKLKPRKKAVSQPAISQASKLRPKARVTTETRVDELLDKISAEGIHSLTEEERAYLQQSSLKK